MIYWFTGQPGHGKTLHGIDKALTWRDEGRLVYVCNVTEFNHEKARTLPMTPEQFRDWPNFLPDGAVALVDEAYEHGMLPKRSPGSKVPHHVEQLAKHRHRGLDFIFISQSPAKQVDEFVHDLIEEHVHVRRRFGLPFAHLRIFDKFEKNPDKGHPLRLVRVKLPKRPMGMYKSTSIDTTERRIPWYYPAAILLLIAIIWLSFHMVNRVKEQLAGKVATVTATKATKEAAEHGAGATGEKADVQPPPRALRQTDYVAWMSPRIGGQPWTAPAYDHLEMPPQAPRLFCMAAGEPGDESCSCLTEQGTRYKVEQNRCLMIAKDGQYEPFRDEVEGERKRLDDTTQLRQLAEFRESHRSGNPQDNASAALAVTMTSADPTVAKYGDIARPTIAANADTSR